MKKITKKEEEYIIERLIDIVYSTLITYREQKMKLILKLLKNKEETPD